MSPVGIPLKLISPTSTNFFWCIIYKRQALFEKVVRARSHLNGVSLTQKISIIKILALHIYIQCIKSFFVFQGCLKNWSNRICLTFTSNWKPLAFLVWSHCHGFWPSFSGNTACVMLADVGNPSCCHVWFRFQSLLSKLENMHHPNNWVSSVLVSVFIWVNKKFIYNFKLKAVCLL